MDEESFSFARGIVKQEDVDALSRDLRDPIKGAEILRYLEKEEPIVMVEARKFAEKETQSFEGTVGLDMLPFLQFSITRAVIHGFLTHKKARDRFWAGINENSRL